MDPLDAEIITGFGEGKQPEESELVEWDGFDRLEKEDAVRFYSGKTWRDVLAHLRGLKDEPVFRGAYFLEEWSVLSPPALAYYARAHLEFLQETLASTQPDEEFVFYFLGQLGQVLRIYKRRPFLPAQMQLLARIVRRISETAEALEAFEYFGDDIKAQAAKVLAEIDVTEK